MTARIIHPRPKLVVRKLTAAQWRKIVAKSKVTK